MQRQLLFRLFANHNHKIFRLFQRPLNDNSSKDDGEYVQNLNMTGIHMDEIDEIMSDGALDPLDVHYPKLDLSKPTERKPFQGHNVMVIQPWSAYANFDLYTDPDLQLEECVSLANTITNWKVVEKRIVFANTLHRKQILSPKPFEELKEIIHSTPGISAVMFGVEVLSAIQLGTLENALGLAVYDRFTTVLNIFRQHARTKEAKLQLALAELPYIKSHLREIHESSEFSSSSESIKMLVGGTGERHYHKRLEILKRREIKLKHLLNEVRKQREILKKSRRKHSDIPTVAVVGYTNSGKTTLIKYLTRDEKMIPLDQLFATLDVSVHIGQLPSSRNVFYLDTVGFISRIPLLLIEAFSATLNDVQESDLIVHITDVSHPDHKLQHATVIKALQSLNVSKRLLDSRITIGNKLDKLNLETTAQKDLPECDMKVSATNGTNMNELVKMIDHRLMTNLNHQSLTVRVENGGKEYLWLRKNSTIMKCEVDSEDHNFLICDCLFSPTALGRWKKHFGTSVILEQKSETRHHNEDKL